MNSVHDGSRTRMDRRGALTILACAGASLKVVAPSVTQAQGVRTFNPAQVLNGADVRPFPPELKSELKQFAPNVYAYVQLQPPGWSNFNISNCGLVVGTDTAVAVDAMAAPIMAKKFLAAAERTTGMRVNRVVVTHFHGDHTGGLQFFANADIIAHDNCRATMAKLIGQPKPANWAKRENWANGDEDFKPAVPNQTYNDKMTFYDGEATKIELIHPGLAHTDGDTLVYLPNQKILFGGDVLCFGVTPLNGSGYVAGLISACDRILAMDVEMIVPGHGPVGGKSEVAEMRDYFVLLQREGKKRFDAGMTAGQAAAEIDLGKYKTWADSDRISTNMARAYAEFGGNITSAQDFAAFTKAREEYTAITSRR